MYLPESSFLSCKTVKCKDRDLLIIACFGFGVFTIGCSVCTTVSQRLICVLGDLRLGQVWSNRDGVLNTRPEVTLCGSRDAKIQELTN